MLVARGQGHAVTGRRWWKQGVLWRVQFEGGVGFASALGLGVELGLMVMLVLVLVLLVLEVELLAEMLAGVANLALGRWVVVAKVCGRVWLDLGSCNFGLGC